MPGVTQILLSRGLSFPLLLSLAMACKHMPCLASRNLVRGKLVFRGLVTVT